MPLFRKQPVVIEAHQVPPEGEECDAAMTIFLSGADPDSMEAELAERTRERDEHAKWRMALADKLHDRETEIAEARADAERMRDAANRIEGDDVLARLRSGNATPEDQYNVANSLAYLWAQDGLLSEAQREVDQLRDQLAEVGRPLDAQMARLNANLLAANRARMDAERELEAARADVERMREALERILQDTHGCRFCDSGRLRSPNNPEKGHDHNCGYLLASVALDAARKERT